MTYSMTEEMIKEILTTLFVIVATIAGTLALIEPTDYSIRRAAVIITLAVFGSICVNKIR